MSDNLMPYPGYPAERCAEYLQVSAAVERVLAEPRFDALDQTLKNYIHDEINERYEVGVLPNRAFRDYRALDHDTRRLLTRRSGLRERPRLRPSARGRQPSDRGVAPAHYMRRNMSDRELDERERAAQAMHVWMADVAEGAGASYMLTTRAWTGEFREDGVLMPEPSTPGLAMIPAYFVGGRGGTLDEGFVAHQLFYSASLGLYAVVETVWAQEPVDLAYPVGKPYPEGTAPLAYLKDAGENGPYVRWSCEDVPAPLRCRVYPEGMVMPHEGFTEDEAREQFPHLWDED